MKVAMNSSLACHSFLMNDEGDVFSFGYTPEGQLGITENKDQKIMHKVMNNPRVKSILLGNCHSLILEKNGDLFGCGRNTANELGLRDNNNRHKFELIAKDVKRAYPLFFSTFIIKNDGKLYFTGNQFGKTCQTFTEYEGIEDVESLSAGYQHVLFLKKNGELWVTGVNDHGQCGFPKEVASIPTPRLLMKDKNIVSYVCGHEYSIIVTRNEKGNTILNCFGINGYGQLGLPRLGLSSSSDYYGIQTNENFPNIASVHCGQFFTIMRLDNGDLYGTGMNNSGHLGQGHTQHASVFTKIPVSDITHVSTACNQTLVVNKNKEIFVFGSGYSNRLGLGRDDTFSTPTKLPFKGLKLLFNHEITEWTPSEHAYFPKSFRDATFCFVLCLKGVSKSNKSLRVPKPLMHLIVGLSSI